MHLEPEQEALPALLSLTLEIIETAQVLFCVTQPWTYFDQELCLLRHKKIEIVFLLQSLFFFFGQFLSKNKKEI